MKTKDIDLFERLSECIRDRRLLKRIHVRLNKSHNDDCSRFLEYLLATFPRDELASVMEYFLTLGPDEWNDIAGHKTGEDVFDHRDRITAIIENLASDPSASQSEPIPGEKEPESIDPAKFLRVLRLHDLASFGLTTNQSLILKFLILVFDGDYAETGKRFGMSRQGVRDAALHASRKIHKMLDDPDT